MRDATLRFPDRATAGAAYEAAGLPASTLVQYPPVRNPSQPDEEAPDAWLPHPDTNWYAAWRGEELPTALAPYEATLADPPIRIAGDLPAAASLGAIRQIKIEQLKSSCQSAIEAGFTSDALGAPHTYESKMPQDQSNLIGAKLAGIDLMYTCVDADGIKAQHYHTAEQMAQVFAAGMGWMQTQKARFYTLKAQVESATDKAALDAINW